MSLLSLSSQFSLSHLFHIYHTSTGQSWKSTTVASSCHLTASCQRSINLASIRQLPPGMMQTPSPPSSGSLQGFKVSRGSPLSPNLSLQMRTAWIISCPPSLLTSLTLGACQPGSPQSSLLSTTRAHCHQVLPRVISFNLITMPCILFYQLESTMKFAFARVIKQCASLVQGKRRPRQLSMTSVKPYWPFLLYSSYLATCNLPLTTSTSFWMLSFLL